MDTELRRGRSLKGTTRPPRNQVGMVSRDTAKLASDLPAVMCSTPECASYLQHARCEPPLGKVDPCRKQDCLDLQGE